MTEVGKRIKIRREALGMSADELAERVGLARATIYRYESGMIDRVNVSKLKPIADALRTTPTYLMGWGDINEPAPAPEPKPKPLPDNLIPVSKMRHHYVPMLGGVAAGEPILCETNYDMVVDAPKKADYALRIEGDSMSPRFEKGDIVYVHAQDDVDDGQVAVVLIDDSATVKKVYHMDFGLMLISENHLYKPMLINADDHDCIRILGKVCGFTRMF